MSRKTELEGRREALVLRHREIVAEEPADGCKLMPFLRWLGRRSEVEVEVRKIDAELRGDGNNTGAIPVPFSMDETNQECTECGERWYTDGEDGQDRCPNCGERAGEFHETM